VILVPCPRHEVQVVREIYLMLIADELTVHGIATETQPQGCSLHKIFQVGLYRVMDLGRFPQLFPCNSTLFGSVRLHEATIYPQMFPLTSPTSTHCRTIFSNSSSNLWQVALLQASKPLSSTAQNTRFQRTGSGAV
jgi:hypothetical protein